MIKPAIFSLLIFLISTFAYGNTQQPVEIQESENDSDALVAQNGNFKFGISLTAGSGLEKIKVGETNENKDITISGGGGVGLSANIGYLILDNIEFDIEIGFQNGKLSEKVDNAEGSFDRTIISFIAKYLISISESSQINLGAGFDYHSPGDLEIDASKVPNGTHEILAYDPVQGFHLLAEYNGFFKLSTHLLSWSAGLVYKHVSFEASSYKRDGQNFDVSLLKDEYKTLNGNSINFIAGMALYF